MSDNIIELKSLRFEEMIKKLLAKYEDDVEIEYVCETRKIPTNLSLSGIMLLKKNIERAIDFYTDRLFRDSFKLNLDRYRLSKLLLTMINESLENNISLDLPMNTFKWILDAFNDITISLYSTMNDYIGELQLCNSMGQRYSYTRKEYEDTIALYNEFYYKYKIIYKYKYKTDEFPRKI